ncbi:DUF3052 domain-containing protein [Tenggerimyces flavus]|uniref:DUF3052 domain-containing protein n=1 Tax=Tenggerimyces flavus TaxID=1708749 RepID=A0ABV7YB00_9ACTN|nr:DUF3052 domain-containing protein [Tenggerimyces flavus]MBM7788928.1 hypothetical protein [Tenggerimyces flavus]
MSATAGEAAGQSGPAERLGFQQGQVVQEIGWDEDSDEELRQSIEEITGNELVDDDYGEVVDAVVLWWRDEDGDLVDALIGTTTYLTGDGGVIWLLTPKVGRDGHVDPSDIAEAAPTAGLSTTSSVPVAPEWSGTRLALPRARRDPKR